MGKIRAGVRVLKQLRGAMGSLRGCTWRARGARGYSGGLGAEPPAGSRGRAPGQGVRGQSPPEADSILAFVALSLAASSAEPPWHRVSLVFKHVFAVYIFLLRAIIIYSII